MNIFENKTEMPPKDNSPDVVRTAQTLSEHRRNLMPAVNSYGPSSGEASVKHVERPRFGHDI